MRDKPLSHVSVNSSISKYFNTSWKPFFDALGIKYDDPSFPRDMLYVSDDRTASLLIELENQIIYALSLNPFKEGLELSEFGVLYSTPAGIRLGRMILGYDPWDHENARVFLAEVVLVFAKMRGEP